MVAAPVERGFFLFFLNPYIEVGSYAGFFCVYIYFKLSIRFQASGLVSLNYDIFYYYYIIILHTQEVVFFFFLSKCLFSVNKEENIKGLTEAAQNRNSPTNSMDLVFNCDTHTVRKKKIIIRKKK